MSRVLVTGANGFVGAALLQELQELSYNARGSVRALPEELIGKVTDIYPVGNIHSETQWGEALSDCDVVIHTAARAHVMNDGAIDPLTEYRKVNVDGTLNLALQAKEQGVKRFIFISSIKVNGEFTELGKPFTECSAQEPEDPYGVSKYEAEQGLLKLSKEQGMEIVIIRPVLVYGAGVKGNFASLINMVRRGLPLPLGGIHNKRSLVALDNLIDLIITCIDHPSAVNQIFLASDGEDLSTTELLKSLAAVLGLPSRLIAVPSWMLRFVATMLGKKGMALRLLSSLQVDNSKAHEVLGWNPPVSVAEGLKRCVKLEKEL